MAGRVQTTRLAIAALVCALAAFLCGGRASASNGHVVVLDIDGVINPLTAKYVERGIARATATGARAVLVRLDTPGGLDSSMRAIVQQFLGSPTPILVHVAPEGARAASAGMFITMAAHVAAMAPATSIGAAHPVALGGQQDATRADKIVHDAAALARALATRHGRNAEWAERAVRESVSITAAEALDERVIDVVAADPAGLLEALHGRTVSTSAGQLTLETKGARLEPVGMTLAERILHVIADPNIAFLLLSLGMLGITLELLNPGTWVPGIVGAAALLVAFVALGVLPTNWAGLLLLALAAAMVIADAMTAGLGVVSLGGLAVFVIGALLLFAPSDPSPALPNLQVSPWIIGGAATVIGAFVLFVGRAVVRARSGAVATGIEALIGRVGVASSELAPAGTVQLGGETWSAVSEGDPVPAGFEVQVVGVKGVTLHVVPH